MKRFVPVLIALSIAKLESAQQLHSIGAPVNTTHTEYAPAISPDDKTIIFQSSRQGGVYKLYESKYDEKTKKWSEPKYLSNINNFFESKTYIFGPCLSYDGNYLYFCTDEKGMGAMDIWVSRRKGKEWTTPTNLGPPINTEGYDGFPAISADGKALYFMRDNKSSNNKTNSGLECYELYVSYKQPDGSWGEPQKLPPPVNLGCERIPRIMPDGKTLYFASYRPGGKGDLDIYKSVLGPDGKWSNPQALDFMNTSGPDNTGSINAACDKMYIASKAGNNWDIFYVGIPPEYRPATTNIVVEGTIADSTTQKPVPAKIQVADLETKEILIEQENNAHDGTYMVVVPTGKDYEITVSAKGYFFNSMEINAKEITTYQEIDKDIKLEKLKKDKPVPLNHIYFDFDSYKLKPESYIELDKVVRLMQENPEIRIELSAHTDDRGKDDYNMILSNNRAKAAAEYIISKGIDKNRIVPRGYGETKPIVPNTTDENRAINRRVEFKIL
ncbi:MAG: OmpA family protein [Bacteroidia bacterium]|nr:OmpA family protein [Bacteroidia bacterium]MDW8301323.1 OmpA family protein [Bacteroidia bacterium]